VVPEKEEVLGVQKSHCAHQNIEPSPLLKETADTPAAYLKVIVLTEVPSVLDDPGTIRMRGAEPAVPLKVQLAVPAVGDADGGVLDAAVTVAWFAESI